MKKITVFLCDDHAIFRAGLRLLLQATDDIEVVGDAADGHQAVAEAARLRPDVVLMDLAMPLLNGIEATRRITSETPSIRVLVLSSYSDAPHVQQALDAGAAGYVMKETSPRDLVLAIHAAKSGNAFFSPLIAESLLQQWRNRDSCPTRGAARILTDRQKDVVQLIAEGYSTNQMAALLSISAHTVEKHRQASMKRLNIHEVATLTRYAISQHLVEAESYRRPTAAQVDGPGASHLNAEAGSHYENIK